MTDIIIYTDGACSGNPGPGGWGVLIQYKEQTHRLCDGEKMTTNNRMELTAAIEALKAVPPASHIKLITDSTYVKDGITLWIENWKKRAWKTAAKKPVKNEDLWRALDEICQKHHIEWVWVRGHTGDVGNEHADKLAQKGMAKYQ